MSEIEKLEQKISELRDDILTNPNNKDKKAIILKAIKFLLTKIPEAKRKDKQEEDKRLQAPIIAKRVKDATAVKGLKEIAGNAKKLLDDIENKKRMVDFYLNKQNLNSNDGKDMLKLMYDKALEELDKYDEAVSKVPNYPVEEVNAYKAVIAEQLRELKNKIIYDLLKSINHLKDIIANPTKYAGGGDNETKKGMEKRDALVKKSKEKSKELTDLIKRFSKEEQREAIAEGKEEDRKLKIYDDWRKLRNKLGYDYFNPLEKTNKKDEKAGEKYEWGNPIGKYAEVKYFYPDRDNNGKVINEAKFRKEQQKRIDDYNVSPEGQKEQREIAEYKDELKRIQAEVDALEAEYPFLLGRSGVSGRVIDGKGIDNPDLYEKAKEIVYKQYSKPSAYRSGQLVKKYKEMGGTYSGEKPDDGLTRWYKEDWKDIGGKEYPVYRPTKRVSKDTPLTASEIDPIQAINQIKLKQVIKGDANLPKFMGKGIEEFSNPKQVMKNAKKYLGKDVAIELSNKKDKKYMVYNPNTKNWVYFGQIGYEDFTKHKDPKRRENYLKRTANMKGNWKDDKYSPNNLSRNLLW